MKNRLIPKGLRSSLSSIGHSSKSGNRFCRRIHFRLLRRTIRDKYALLSVVDNNIRIYDWNLRSFNLGSRFYQNFYIHAKTLALKASEFVNGDYAGNSKSSKWRCGKPSIQTRTGISLQKQHCIRDRWFGIWVELKYRLKLRN